MSASRIVPPSLSAADDTRRPSEIVWLCKKELAASGFTERKGGTIWRRTNLKFDILKFDFIPRSRSEKWRVPLGSFGLEPSCLFPFLPRVGHAPTDALHPEKGFGQVRLSIRDEISQRADKAPRIWCLGEEGIIQSVLGTISNKALPFFHRFENQGELLRTLLEDEDAIGREGVWDFGKKGSPKRLLYTGFAAIECSMWDLAIPSLLSCKAKLMRIPEPVGQSVRAEYLPYIQEGIACAEEKCAWKYFEGPGLHP